MSGANVAASPGHVDRADGGARPARACERIRGPEPPERAVTIATRPSSENISSNMRARISLIFQLFTCCQ
jgi:hypothetical protein